MSEVLLYDRLVIPVPDPTRKAQEEQRWQKKGWEPALLDRCLKVLGVQNAGTDGLALAVPWDKEKEERFAARMSMTAALATQRRVPNQPYYVDPYEMTRRLMAKDFKPSLPRGVRRAWTVANFPSSALFRAELKKRDKSGRVRLALLIRHQFLTPKGPDPKQKVLRRAVDLATSDGFRAKRAKLYDWQQQVIEEKVKESKALEEMDSLLRGYNKAVETAFKDTYTKFAFTVLAVSLGLGGAVVSGGGTLPLVLAGGGGVVEMLRFWKSDRKPEVKAGDCDAAAMIHDARSRLPLLRR